MLSIWQIFHLRLYYYVHFLISQYLPCDKQSMITRVNNKTVSFYMTVQFFFTFESIYIKYLQYGKKIDPIISKYMWPHVFISKFGSYFPCFWLSNWIIFFSLLYVEIVQLIQRWEGAGIYCKLIPDLIKSTPSVMLFPVQYRTKFEILPGELFRKYHRVIIKTDSLYLYSLMVTTSRVFSPGVFPRP